MKELLKIIITCILLQPVLHSRGQEKTALLSGKIDSISLITNDSVLLKQYLAICFTAVRDSLDLADLYSRLALDLAKELDNHARISEAYTCRGEFYYYSSQYDSAIYYYNQGLDHAARAGDSLQMSKLDFYIGHALYEISEYNKAIDYTERSFLLDSSRKDSLGMASNYNLLGMCHESLNHYKLAISNYNKALDLNYKLSDSLAVSTAYNNLGNVYTVSGNYEKALDYYLKALQIEQAMDNTIGLAVVLNNIGIVYHDWKQYDRALDYYKRGYDYELMQDNPAGMASSLNNMAIIYDEFREYDTALILYKKALQLQEENNDLLGQAISLGNIGEFLIERKKYTEAREYLESALSIYHRINDRAGIGRTYNQFGILHSKRKQYEQAIAYFKKSIHILDSLGIHDVQTDNYKKLASVYRDLGNYRKAFEYQLKFQELNDSIFSTQAQEKLSTLQYDFDLQQRENEIKLLNNENKLNQLALEKQELAIEQQKKSIRLVWIVAIISMLALIVIIIITLMLMRQYRQKTAANKLLQEQKYKLEENRMELIHAKEKAEESDRLKTAFLANMSHEIRTPMNGILGFAELLMGEDLNKTDRDYYINIISENSRQLIRILNDILDISLIETNQLKIQNKSVNLNKLMEEVFVLNREIRQTGKKENIKFTLNLPDAAKMIKAYTDPYRLEQILNNLVSNAFKYTEKGSIEMGMNILAEEYEFFVKDTGIGISEDQQGLIFDRFRQLEDSHTRKYGGTGLGLTISKQLAGMLGGDLRVESGQGKGSTFRLRIPYNKTADKPDNRPDNFSFYHEKVNYPDLSSKTLLIAEDNEDNYQFISTVLGKTACKIYHATNGRECIELFREVKADLVIMDLQMPVMNGIDAAKEIKKIDDKINIIAVTAYTHLRNKDEMIRELFSDYLIKPVSSRELVSVVATVLNKN
ncbi:MAG: tetratricopeptide repeat protein [Bacteroidota bacterium]|nr:tetratricopeptide repeat protein [Bacteroidota bacterium]